MDRTDVLWERLGALSGILFAVLLFAGMSLGGDESHDPSQPAAVLASRIADERDRVRLGVYLALLGVFFLLWFLGYLRRHLQQAEGERGWFTAVAYGGGLVFAGMLLVGLSYAVAATVLSDYGEDPQVARALAVLGWEHLAVVAPPLAALVGGTAAVSLRFGAVPRWLGWVGVAITLALLTPTYFFAFLAALVWLIALCVVLLLRTRSVPHRESAHRPVRP